MFDVRGLRLYAGFMRKMLSEGEISMKSRSSVNYSPNDDYYTPASIFKALNLHFDLDVCAPKDGVPWLPSKKHYHLEIDGLAQPWEGLIWCNPPYSKPAPWIDRFIQHSNGIMLVQISRSNGFIRLWDYSHGILVPDHKMMRFITIEGKTKTIFMPVALFAMGEIANQALINSGLGRVR